MAWHTGILYMTAIVIIIFLVELNQNNHLYIEL